MKRPQYIADDKACVGIQGILTVKRSLSCATDGRQWHSLEVRYRTHTLELRYDQNVVGCDTMYQRLVDALTMQRAVRTHP